MDNLLYHLAENQLTPDPDDCMAITEPTSSYTDSDVLDEMMKRGTSLTRTDVLAVLNLYNLVVSDLVAQGKPINLLLCNGTPSISGVFTNPTDAFDPARHFVKYNLTPGTLIRDAVKRIKLEKTERTEKLPYVEQFVDVSSQTSNDVLTPGGIGELNGSRLSFDSTDEQQGICFVAADGTETKVTTIAFNKPAKLIFMVPALAAGSYELVLRVKYKGSKMVRATKYRKVLTVVA